MRSCERAVMKVTVFTILVLITAMLAGCLAELAIPVVMPDGTISHATYKRWGTQSLEKVTVKAPGGWEITIEGQKSPFELGVEFGAAKVTAGGGQ